MSDQPLAFVGDIHGMAPQLRRVLDGLGGIRHLVFLGDYVNRGTDSRDVLEMLLEAKASWPQMVTLLRGNHEEELLHFLATGNLSRFVGRGGLRTIASYTKEVEVGAIEAFRHSFPISHLRLIVDLSDYFENDDVIASHCGINPIRPWSRERIDVATGSHKALFRIDARGLVGKSVVCGHYVQGSMEPFVSNGLYAIDTGCGTIADAPLTVLLWPEKTTIQFGGPDASRH